MMILKNRYVKNLTILNNFNLDISINILYNINSFHTFIKIKE